MTNQNSSFHVLLGVCGSVAAFKAQELCRQLIHVGAEVQVVLTPGATQFVTPLSFQSLSGRLAFTDLFDPTSEARFGHIELARWADVILVAPASADFMAKAALGLADDLLSTLLLASKAPLLFAPAMNSVMWEHPATQSHLRTLQERGAKVIQPDEGLLACGEEGMGKLADLRDILRTTVQARNTERPLSGRRVLVTAGPTVEPIDPVRYLTNRSSGKMGFALASAAMALGAEVTLVSGPVHLPTPAGVKRLEVQTAEEMYSVVLEQFLGSHLTLMCAAVGDFSVVEVKTEKLKKSDRLTLELKKNPDILAELGKIKKANQVLVGFAAETQDLERQIQAKRQRKQADWIIGNDVSNPKYGFDSDQNLVLICDATKQWPLGPSPKGELAESILAALLQDPELGPKLRA